MTTKKQKKHFQKQENIKKTSALIDAGYNMLEIAQIMEVKLRDVQNYCSVIRKIPGLGDFDLNYYLNGYIIRKRKKEEKLAKEEFNKPFKPDDNWFDKLDENLNDKHENIYK